MLFKLKLFKEAEIELKQFENFEFFYDYLPDQFPNRKGFWTYFNFCIKIKSISILKGTIIPFVFRILKSELMVYLKRSDESLAELNNLLVIVNKVIKELKDIESDKLSFFKLFN